MKTYLWIFLDESWITGFPCVCNLVYFPWKISAFQFQIWYNCCILTSVIIYHLVNPVKKYSLFVHCGWPEQHSSPNTSKLSYKRQSFMMKIFLLTWWQLCFRLLTHVQALFSNSQLKMLSVLQFENLCSYFPVPCCFILPNAFQIYYASSIRDVL